MSGSPRGKFLMSEYEWFERGWKVLPHEEQDWRVLLLDWGTGPSEIRTISRLISQFNLSNLEHTKQFMKDHVTHFAVW